MAGVELDQQQWERKCKTIFKISVKQQSNIKREIYFPHGLGGV